VDESEGDVDEARFHDDAGGRDSTVPKGTAARIIPVSLRERGSLPTSQLRMILCNLVEDLGLICSIYIFPMLGLLQILWTFYIPQISFHLR
jgi:hypothetical protein